MRPVLSRDEARRLDAWATTFAHVPSIVLMENAGRGAAARILAATSGRGKPSPRIVLLCGTGNNGGDGFVVARHARIAGVEPQVFLVGEPGALAPDARTNREAYERVGGVVEVVDETGMSGLEAAVAGASVVVDALFGTGVDRPIGGLAARAIEAANRSSAKRFALDLPSGLDADTGLVQGTVFNADVTITFAHPKLGLLTPGGARHAGDVAIVHIGVPGVLPPEIGASAELLGESDVRAWGTRRDAGGHKYTAGHVLIVGGSPGHIGAASMAAHAAMRAGAGLVTIASWPDVATQLEARIVEIMTSRITDDIEASIGAVLERKSAVVVGPGLGTDVAAARAVDHLLATARVPLVLDADALTIAARNIESLAASCAVGPRILTPHAGEMGRLLDCPSQQVEADRYAAVREAARRTRCTVVLKGAYTLVASMREEGASGARVRVVVAGGAVPALATAGAGDVLAGMAGGLLAALPPFEAACVAVHVHARAAARWASIHGDRGLLATEVADLVPLVLRELAFG